MAKSKRGIVQAPAGAGKTHIAASALAFCLLKRKGVADVEIMANTREQVEQMQTACDPLSSNKRKGASANLLRSRCANGKQTRFVDCG